MSSLPNVKNLSILQVHESTLPTLSEVERIFLDRFVAEGKAVIVPDQEGE